MFEKIVLNGYIKTVTTNWADDEIKISIASSVDDAEFERENLGGLARNEVPCSLKIHEKDGDEDLSTTIDCWVQSVKTDHKTLQVNISVQARVTEDNIIKARSLGMLSTRDKPITAYFESRQSTMRFEVKELTMTSEQ